MDSRDRSRDRERSPARSPTRGLGMAASLAASSSEPEAILRQNRELRRRMEEEQAAYRRRLDTYRQVSTHLLRHNAGMKN